MTLTFEQVERWLDDNPDLTEDHFIRKGTARMILLWNEAREECPDVFSPDASSPLKNCDDTVDIIGSNEEGEHINQLIEARSRALTSPTTEPQRENQEKQI